MLYIEDQFDQGVPYNMNSHVGVLVYSKYNFDNLPHFKGSLECSYKLGQLHLVSNLILRNLSIVLYHKTL